MAYQREGKKFGGRSKTFGKPKFSSRPFEKKGKSLELFDVTCDNCGKATQIPFKPTGGKPVYCRDCFNKGSDQKSFVPRSKGTDDLSEINRKLDKIMRALKIE
jgi:CxxC-x17-CxxC domain-containing protein